MQIAKSALSRPQTGHPQPDRQPGLLSPSRMEREGWQDVRFEFRCWPLEEQAREIEAYFEGWESENEAAQADTYILWLRHPEFLPKLRHGRRLEVKQRLATYGRLEEWGMALADDFPLSERSQTWLSARHKDLTGCAVDLWASSVNAFICQASIEADWRYIDVVKARRLFRDGPFYGELTRFTCGGMSFVTAAIESPDAPALQAVAEAPPFSGLANRSYGEFLRAAIGR